MLRKYILNADITYQPFEDGLVINSENNSILIESNSEKSVKLNSSTPRINVFCETNSLQDIKNSEVLESTFENDFVDEQFYKPNNSEYTNSIDKIKDLSFKIEDHLSKNDSSYDYMKFLDQLENQRPNIDIKGSGESDEVIKGYNRDNDILKKKIEIIKSQLEEVDKEHKNLNDINDSLIKGKTDYLKKLKTRKEEMLTIDDQYKILVHEVKNNYIINYKIYNSQVKSKNNNFENKNTCFTDSDPYISNIPNRNPIFTSNSQNIDTEKLAKEQYYRSERETSEFFPEINNNSRMSNNQLSEDNHQKSVENKIYQKMESLRDITKTYTMTDKDKSYDQSNNISFDNLTIKNSNNKNLCKTDNKNYKEEFCHGTPFTQKTSINKDFDSMNVNEFIDKSMIEKIQESLLSKGTTSQNCDQENLANIINDLIKHEQILNKEPEQTNDELFTTNQTKPSNSSYMSRFLKKNTKKKANKFTVQNKLYENKENLNQNLHNFEVDTHKETSYKKNKENQDTYGDKSARSPTSNSFSIYTKAQKSNNNNCGIFGQLKQKAYQSVFRDKCSKNSKKL